MSANAQPKAYATTKMEHASARKDSLGVDVIGSPSPNVCKCRILYNILNHSNKTSILLTMLNYNVGAQADILNFRVAQDAIVMNRDPCLKTATGSPER